MGLAMAKFDACVLAQCMSELVRRDGVDWSSLAKMMRA